MKKIYLVLFVILSIFVFSCKDNLISDDLSSSQNSGVGQVKVFVKQSRLIGPDVSDVDWTVELYKGNDKFSGKNKNGYYLFSGLSDGTYNITVSGKTGDVEKFTGSAVTTITNGNSVSVNVPIVAKKTVKENGDGAEKKGYATITMDMSDKLLSLLNSMGPNDFFEANLYSVDGNDNEYKASLVKITYDDQVNRFIDIYDNKKVEFVDNNPSPSETTGNPIPTGYYCLTFSGLEDFSFTIKLKDDLVEIGDGLTTNIVLTQNDYELVENLSQIFYVDDEDGNHTKNENGGIEDSAGTSLSNPLGFRNIDSNVSRGIIYLISDVNTYEENQNKISSISVKTIASFGSNIFSIINNYEDSNFRFERTFLKNIKLTNTTGNGFSLLQCPVDGTVILDSPIVQDSNTDSTVIMNKSSNLVIGQKFSGELGICLSSENWQLGDTVVTFENGKPDNANFYIWENNDMPTGFASTFYIDDNGKLAQYDASSQWVNFAWDGEWPYLITQTQAKNKTFMYVELSDSFTGVSTYDGNRTWYFIANGTDLSGYTVSSLYKVSAPTEYTGSVTPEKICEVKLDEAGQTQINVQDIYIYNDKIYLCNLLNGSYEVYVSNLNDIDFDWIHSTVDTVTALLVKNDVIYIATTLTDTTQQNVSTTHSAIWKYTLSEYTSGNGVYYHLIPVESYVSEVGECPVPYYLTQYDNMLTIDTSFPKNSTFRITDLYSSEDGSIYGLLANYIEKKGADSVGIDEKNKSFMRGSVFKLEQNTSRQNNTSEPMMNANHFGLRNSFPLTTSELPTAKQYFILPRKIVGILNKKLVIVDDGMVPDSNDCNVDRFALFDLFNLADEISETIDVAVPFSTNGVVTTSAPTTFYTKNYLFN